MTPEEAVAAMDGWMTVVELAACLGVPQMEAYTLLACAVVDGLVEIKLVDSGRYFRPLVSA